MRKSSKLVLLLFMIIWIIISILATTWGTMKDWPDNVHIDYGFPFVWSTQTLSTIAGPTVLWTVDITGLTVNLALWLGIMLIGASALFYFLDMKE